MAPARPSLSPQRIICAMDSIASWIHWIVTLCHYWIMHLHIPLYLMVFKCFDKTYTIMGEHVQTVFTPLAVVTIIGSGFSLMNIIKTFLSNRLRVCLVSDLMTIKSSEWKLDYVVDVLGDEIIGKYNAMKERRCAVQSYTKPSYKEKKRKKNKKCNDKQEAD
eukprot:806013_1